MKIHKIVNTKHLMLLFTLAGRPQFQLLGVGVEGWGVVSGSKVLGLTAMHHSAPQRLHSLGPSPQCWGWGAWYPSSQHMQALNPFTHWMNE